VNYPIYGRAVSPSSCKLDYPSKAKSIPAAVVGVGKEGGKYRTPSSENADL
jgi:hypothetical protein